MKSITFFVPGKAQTSGSKRGFALRKNGQYTGQVLMTPANPRERDWKNAVAAAAFVEVQKCGLKELITGPVRLEILFVMQRPQFHFNSKGLKKTAPEMHVCMPDLTKLLRCAEDALSGVVWADDCQVCTSLVRKRYGAIPGAQLTITEEVESRAVSGEVPRANQQSLAI